ncbi:MAG TPA: YfiR family protein [Puia sp.]|nr:YfiR family protein [Puia sp.]
MLIINLPLVAQAPLSREYELKAVFLYNFAQFVEWPPTAFSNSEAPLIIGVIGKNPFGTRLKDIVSGEKVNGHDVSVQYYDNAEDIGTCHILFINLPEAKKREQVLQLLKDRNILTVSDAPGFPAEGGMIRLFTRDNKIRFEVNLEVSRAAGLSISSKLLRLADLFTPSKNS